MDDTKGFQCLGHSNWTHCNPLSPFCSEIVPPFDFLTGECQFFITPEIEESGILPIWMRHRGLKSSIKIYIAFSSSCIKRNGIWKRAHPRQCHPFPSVAMRSTYASLLIERNIHITLQRCWAIRLVPRLRELSHRGQREPGGGIHAT